MINGFAAANFLESHDKVEKESHPGLKSHPQHKLAHKQCSGFSAMVSFYLKCDAQATIKFVQSLKLFCQTESLGCITCLDTVFNDSYINT